VKNACSSIARVRYSGAIDGRPEIASNGADSAASASFTRPRIGQRMIRRDTVLQPDIRKKPFRFSLLARMANHLRRSKRRNQLRPMMRTLVSSRSRAIAQPHWHRVRGHWNARLPQTRSTTDAPTKELRLARLRVMPPRWRGPPTRWLGYDNRSAWVRRLTPVVDHPLRLIPSLCSNLYMIGRKPPSGALPTAAP
jgi:hypothetical protein